MSNIDESKINEQFISNHISKLVAAGYLEPDATDKVNKIVKAIQAALKGEDEAVQISVINLKVAELTKISKDTTRITSAVIAVSDRADANDYTKKHALEAYQKNPTVAIQDGIVAIIPDPKTHEGIPTPLDTKTHFGEPKTDKNKNKNFGKPLGTKMQRTFTLIATIEDANKNPIDVIATAYGDIELHAGSLYNIFGKYNDKTSTISISKTPGAIKQKNLDPRDIWAKLNKLGEDSPIALPLNQIASVADKSLVLTKGTIAYSGTTTMGGMVIINDEDFQEGMACMFNGEYLVADVLPTLQNGNEVIIIGKKSTSERDGAPSVIINATAVVKNPDSDKFASAMKGIDAIIYG